MKLIQGIFLIVIAQILSYVQLQGPSKWEFVKKHQYAFVLLGIPIGFILINSTRLINSHFGGSTWPGRLIGQSIGVLMFTILSYLVFKEGMTMKTGVCVALSVIIILIQIYWK